MKGRYHRVHATERSEGWRGGIWTIENYEVVLVTATWRIDTKKGKPDRDRPSRRSNDGPFTMSVVWVTVRKAGAGEYTFVAQESPSTTRRRGGPDNVISIVGD